MEPRRAACLTLLALLMTSLASGAASQVSQPSPDAAGRLAGASDGRMEGRELGSDLGRSQVLVSAYLDSFRRALSRGGESWRSEDAFDEGASAGREQGEHAGERAGRERGRLDATEAFARLAGRPRQGVPPMPDVASPPPPPAFADCEAPSDITLSLPRGRSVRIDPADDGQRSPLPLDVPEPDFPSSSSLRSRARSAGFMIDSDIEWWVRGYRDAFETEFEDVFAHERENVSYSVRQRWEDDGDIDGLREAERRARCEAFGRGFESGHAQAFREAHARSYEDGWAETDEHHSRNAVVLVESAQLIDASGDGIVEPGESVSGRITVANAGLLDATHPLRWRGVQSLVGEGDVRRELPAQQRATHTLDLGAVDASAPLGATAVAELQPQGGDRSSLSATVGRPVVLEEVTAFLDVAADGASLVTSVRAHLVSRASLATRRDLSVVSGDLRESVGELEAAGSRDIVLRHPADASDLLDSPSGEVRLDEGDAVWMRASWTATTSTERGVELAGRLRPDARKPALDALSSRLGAEYARALVEPTLYREVGDRSELAQLARALGRLPAADRPALDRALAAPLRERAAERKTPRKVRRAVKDALGE